MIKALNFCHQKGTETVIVTSSSSFDKEKKNHLVLYASSKGNYYATNVTSQVLNIIYL